MKQNIYSFLTPVSTSSKSSTKHCNSKTFCVLWNILQNILFLNFSQSTFKKITRFNSDVFQSNKQVKKNAV